MNCHQMNWFFDRVSFCAGGEPAVEVGGGDFPEGAGAIDATLPVADAHEKKRIYGNAVNQVFRSSSDDTAKVIIIRKSS